MKGKFVIYIVGFVLFLTACSKKASYVLEGNITGLVHPALYIVTSFDHDTKIDTLLSKDGQFQFVAIADSIQPVIIYMEEGSVWMTVWVQNGETIQIEGDANEPELIKTSGNEINDLLTGFRQENQDILKERNDATCEAPHKADLDQALIENTRHFIQEHPASIASLVLIQDYLTDSEDPAVLDESLSLIESPAKESKLYARLNAVYHRIQQTATGSPTPDFSVTDIKGDTLTPASFQGRYLLLAFENSGCDACKEDCAVLKTLQKTYHKKGLDILSIALDENPNEWKQLAKECKIDWQQVIDPQGLASPLISLYNISTLPDYFLIDKENKIIEAHTTLKEIEAYVSQSLCSSPSGRERYLNHN
jgi:peroxiredoxin